MWPVGRSPSAGPNQSGSAAAQRRWGKIEAFCSGMQEIKYFSGWRFAADGQSRVRSTNSPRVCSPIGESLRNRR